MTFLTAADNKFTLGQIKWTGTSFIREINLSHSSVVLKARPWGPFRTSYRILIEKSSSVTVEDQVTEYDLLHSPL